ncbi:MAG: hypothetical protein ABW022_18515 [Actinoplanes sp.]
MTAAASAASTSASRGPRSCAGDAGARSACFEPRSADYLAGHDHAFGAVGAPDSDEMADPAAHCDGADFVAGDYPRTREAATGALRDCVTQMRTRFREAVDRAAGLLDDEGDVIAGEVDPGTECSAQERSEVRAKCASLEAFGRRRRGQPQAVARPPAGADRPVRPRPRRPHGVRSVARRPGD